MCADSFRIATSVLTSDTGYCRPQRKGCPKLPTALFLEHPQAVVFLPNCAELLSANRQCAVGGAGRVGLAGEHKW